MKKLTTNQTTHFTKLLVLMIAILLSAGQLTAQTVVEYGSYVTGGGAYEDSNTGDDVINMFEDATGIYYVSIHDEAGLQTTPGVYQPNFGGGQDLIMVKVDHTGQVVWSTFLGGPGFEGDGEPFFRTDKAFLVEGDGLYVSVKSSDTGILPGFNYIGTPTENTTLFAKLNLSTGALEWGTAIYTYDDQEIDPRDIYVDNGKVYVISDDYGPGTNGYTTPDALETNGQLYLTILDGATGIIDYATYYDAGSNSAQAGQIAVAGNILAITGHDFISAPNQRNTTADAFSSVGTVGEGNGFLAYFDITTRQIVYDTYVNDASQEVEQRLTIDLQTDGTRFYYLQMLGLTGGFNFVVNPPYTRPVVVPLDEIQVNPWMQIWNVDRTLETSYDVPTKAQGDVIEFLPYLTVDAANDRYFLHSYGDYISIPEVNSLAPPPSPGSIEDGGFIMEFEISSGDLVFTQFFQYSYFGPLDVEIDANGNLFMLIEGTTNGNLDQFITPDALFGTDNRHHQVFLKLDANRELVYGTYLGNNTSDDRFLNRQAQINILDGGQFEVYGYTYRNGRYDEFTSTVDAQYAPSENSDFFYLRLNCCPEGTENTIINTMQEVCIDGLTEVIEGSQVSLSEDYPDFLYEGTLMPQGQNVPWGYQWQASFDNVIWADIPGATTKDFLPAPTSVDVFFRRISRPLASICLNADTSNVHTLTVNALQAPSLEEGLSLTCPDIDVLISEDATGGTGGTYTYQWNPSTDLDDAMLAQPTYSGVLGGIYTVTVTDDGNLCQFAENWEVRVITADAGEDQNICPGEDQAVVIGAPAPVEDGISYSWDVMPGGDDISSLNDPNVAQPLASPGVTTMYQLTTTVVATGCSTNSTMTVFVDDDPGATAGPDLVLCLGEDAVLGGETDQPGFTYGWAPGLYIDNQNVAQPNFMSSLCPTDDPFLATGNPLVYTVTKIDNVSGCVDIDTVEIVVLQIDLYNQKSNCIAPALIGDRAAECGLDLPDVTFLWTIVEGDLASLDLLDETMPTLTVDPAVSTLYQLQVLYDGVGYCTDTVRVSPDCDLGCGIALVATSDINCPVGGDFNTTISAAGSVEGVDINSLPPGYTFEWDPMTSLVSPTSTTTAVGPLGADQTYTFNVRNPNGDILCTETIDVFATVAANPIIGIPPSVEGCLDAEITIGLPEVGGWAYVWSPADDLSDADGNPGANEAQPTVTVTQDREYIVVATDIVTGCEYRDTVEVVVTQPIANAGPDRTFCENAIVTLGTAAIPNYSYSWTPSLGLTQPNVAQPTDTIFASVTYFLEVTDDLTGCIARDTVEFTITTPPDYDAPDVTICEGSGGQIGLPAEPGFSYFWSPATGLSDPNVAQPFANPTSNTTYTVVVDAGNPGCYAADQVAVTVVPTSFSLELDDITECVGTTVNIGVPGQGGTYTWSPTAGLSDSADPDPEVTVADTVATYILTWDTPDGCPLVDTVVITPIVEEAIDFVMSYEVCEGESVMIGDDTEDPAATYSWSVVLGDDISSLSSASVYNPIATPDQTTIYLLTYTSAAGCVQTKMVTVTVTPLPPPVDLGPDIASCVTETLTVNPTGQTGILWSTGATTNSITVTPRTSPTEYSVTITYGGCTTSDTIIISPLVVADAGPNISYCRGGDPEVPVTIGTPGQPGLTYTWSVVFGDFASLPAVNTTPQIDVAPGGFTRYRLTVNNGMGCVRTDLVDVFSSNPPVLDLGPDQTICNGQCVELSVEFLDYLTYSWTPTTGIAGATNLPTVTICPTSTETYTLEAVDNFDGCTYTSTIVITVLPDLLDAADAGVNAVACEGVELTLGTPDASGGTVNYNWTISAGPGPLPAVTTTAQISVTPTATTTYLLSIDDGGSCMGMDEVTVTILPNPDPVDLGSDQTVCINGCIEIGVPAVAGNSYEWFPATGITDPTQTQITVCPTTDITYTLFVTNDVSQCVLSDDIRLTIGTETAPTADAGEDVGVCSGETVEIGAPSMPGLIYQWSPTTDLTNFAQGNPTFIGTTPGDYTYTLTVVDQMTNCISMTDTVVVTVTLPPNPTIAPPGDFCQGGVVQINATVSNTVAADLTYSWLPAAIFEDPTVEDPVIVSLTDDTNITLLVTNALTGCVTSATTLVSVSTNTLELELLPDVEACLGEEVVLGINTLSYPGETPGGELYAESFEAVDLGGWTQNGPGDADNFDWTQLSGETPTTFTGPSGALDGSSYLYTNVDFVGGGGNSAIIRSPAISLPAAATTMSFEYHMYSALATSMGSLTLEISDDGGTTWDNLWTRSGSQGDFWQRAIIDISAYAGSMVNIRFTGTKGTTLNAFWSRRGDIAIDDIRFSANTLPIILSSAWTSADQGSTSFTNDATYFISGQNSSMPTVNTSSEDFDRTYQLIVTDGITGCSASDEVNVTVNGPLAIIAAGNDAFVCGDSYTMTATPPGDSPIVGTWSQVSGPTTATFSDVNDPVAMISGLSVGTYQFEWAITGSCEDGSDLMTIVVVDPPALVTNVTCTPSGMVDLTVAEVTEGSMLDGANLTYWLNAAATSQVPDATNVVAGTYYIRAFNPSTSCEVILPVEVGMSPIVTVAEPATICSSQAIDLTQGASIVPTDLGGTWSTPDGSVAAFTTGTDFATATTYVPTSADAMRGSVTLVLTSNDPDGPCVPTSVSVTFTILKVDCGTFPWDGN